MMSLSNYKNEGADLMLTVSYSHLDKSRQDCQLQYYYTYYLRKKSDMCNIYAIQGTAIHKTLELGYENGYLKPLPKLISIYLGAYDGAFITSFNGDRKKLIVMNKDCKGKPWKYVYDKFKHEGIDILTNYYTKHKDEYQEIIGTEKNIDIIVNGDNTFRLIGYMDKVVEEDNDTIRVIDYKTSSSTGNVDKLKDNLQLKIYDYALREQFPNYKKYIVSLNFVKLNKIVSHEYSQEQREETINIINSYVEEIGIKHKIYDYGIIPSPNRGSSCVFCEYRDICPAFK